MNNYDRADDYFIEEEEHLAHEEIVSMYANSKKIGKPVLCEALSAGYSPAVIKSLIECGADVNEADSQGATPLLFAIEEQSFELIRLLIDKGADVNEKDSLLNTPLLYALHNKSSKKIIELLINKGADVNAKNLGF